MTFAFRVCTSKTKEEAVSQEKTVEIHPGRLLLAEDNELNQEIAVEILKEAGFSVTVAENGQVALNILKIPSWENTRQF